MNDLRGDGGSGDPGLFGPDSVTWRVHSHPSMLVGGIRALMLQALEPRAMAAVAEHSDFRTDPWGRMRRTADYVTNTTFGDTPTARREGAIVRAIHHRINGIDPYTGRPYSADDPELLAWIHNVEVDSFMSAYRHYGARLTPDDADRYVSEMVRAAELVGLDAGDVPGSARELETYMREVPMDASPAARAAMPFLIVPPVDPPNVSFRAMWTSLALASVAILPARARRLYNLRWTPLLNPGLRAGVGTFLKASAAIVAPNPAIAAAHERVGRATHTTRAA
jgi:uncharacterized protein (DUF2236 family)